MLYTAVAGIALAWAVARLAGGVSGGGTLVMRTLTSAEAKQSFAA